MLLENSRDIYRLWWEAIAENNTLHSSLELISRKVLKYRKDIPLAYDKIKDKTRELVDLYIAYLYYVERNL